MQQLKHCLNLKVVAGLVVVAAGIWVFAPGAFAAALPVLILAICPLSMIGMMFLMRGGGQGTGSSAGASSHTQDSPQHARGAGAQAEGRGIEALQAQVAELEQRLAAESRSAEALPAEAPSRQPGVREAG